MVRCPTPRAHEAQHTAAYRDAMMTTVMLAAVTSVAAVMTIWVLVRVETVHIIGATPPPIIVTPGVPVLIKKSDGYVSVMLLQITSAPPAWS